MNIIIRTKNLYFALGLLVVIESICKEKGIINPRCFISKPKGKEREAVFLSKTVPTSTSFIYGKSIEQSINILIMTSPYDQVMSLVKWNHVIRVYDSILDVNNMLCNAIDNLIKGRFYCNYATPPLKATFVPIEKKILECFGRGYGPAQTARLVKSNIKQVSHHKRNIMMKLNIEKNTDFYKYCFEFYKK